MSEAMSSNRECFRADGRPKARYASKPGAVQAIQKIAAYRRRHGGARPNAYYRCRTCGGFHLYRRNGEEAKRIIS